MINVLNEGIQPVKLTLFAAAGLALASSFFTPVMAAEPVRFAATDIEGLEELRRQYGTFRDVLSEATGLDIEFFPVNNRTVASEALRAERVDFVLAGASEYVILNSRTKLQPVVAFSRPDYFTAIVVRSDSGIRNLEDLKGKRVAFWAVGSSSGHVGPAIVLSNAGIDPVKDIEPVHLSAAVAYEALKRGDVAAMASSQEYYKKLREEDRDATSATFRAIARGADLPNDLILAGGHVAPDIVEKIRHAFEEPATAEKLKQALIQTEDGKSRYALTAFLPTVDDHDYDYMRRGYIAIGQPQFAKTAGN